MADDEIDIVEHDLLDNPLIRRIFPDLSILKKELIDFNNEVPVTNIPERVDVIKQNKNEHKTIKEESEANVLPFSSFPTDKIVSTTLLHDNTLQEINEVQEGIKNTLCSEDTTTSHIMEINTTKGNQNLLNNVAGTSSLLIKSKYETTHFCNKRMIKSDIKLNFTRVQKALKKTSMFLKQKSTKYHERKISQEISLQRENNSSATTISACTAKSNPSYFENHQVKQRRKYKLKQNNDNPIKNSFLRFKCNKIILGSKPSVMEANIKVSENPINSSNVKVTLENLNTFLNKSTRYCKICFRLFPSNKTLANHQSLIHDQSCELVKGKLLINNKNTKTKVESFEQNIQSQSQDKFNRESKSFKCTHCDLSFISQQLLIDHMYNVLQTKHKDTNIESDKKCTKNEWGKNTCVKKYTSPNNFYRCSFCSYYFKSKKLFINHVTDKHKKLGKIKFEKVGFDPICIHCSNKYANVTSFNAHVWKYHQKRMKMHRDTNMSIKITESVDKAKCEEHCLMKKCSLNLVENDFKNNEGHSSQINGQLEHPKNHYLLKSALFKCTKCDICFLSGSKAADHVKHMNKLINWKCLKCLRIFKKEDELFHTQQHSFTDTFDVYDIRDIPDLFILYKCPNCTTYFCENDFFKHYSMCEIQSPDSAYCKICHILIDSKFKEIHDTNHRKVTGDMEENNTFVESDVIICSEDNLNIRSFEDNKDLNREADIEEQNIIKEDLSGALRFSQLEKETKSFLKKIPSFTFCSTCRCFVRRTQNLYYHTKARCSHLVKFVCRYCGLILSSKSINFHRKLHRDMPGLTLHDFKFYDLNSGNIICPPLPKYPNCNKCEKHFITKTAIISHQCGEDYLTCPVCKIKLSYSAFPLHLSFHNYLPKNEIFNISNKTFVLDNQRILNLPSKLVINPSSSVTTSKNVLESSKNEKKIQLLVYVCKICKVSLDVYDKVIEHCQDHISSQEKEIKTKLCDTCNLIFDVTCFENHYILHASNHDKEFTVLSFDTFYATAENNIWFTHLFGSLSKETIEKILGNTVYTFERRVKMKILQDGPACLTLYRCGKCKKHVDASSLYKHCQMDILCSNSKIIPCSYCGIILVSKEYLIEHEKIHEQQHVTFKSYRIVLFNCEEDKATNYALSLPNHYILYECRYCNAIVDKMHFKNHSCDFNDLAKCSHCGLLFCTNDYLPHVLKHKEFCSYNVSSMKVISIGQIKYCAKSKHRMIPSFTGVRLDYIMYQCNKCQVCVKDKESSLTHVCAMNTAITKCLACELYIDNSQFKNHRKFHECNIHFLKENLAVVKFGLATPKPSDEDVIVIEDEDDSENMPNKIFDDNKRQSEIVVEKSDEIFKCICGLHFLKKQMALSHYNMCSKSGSDKQMCSKCGLAFTPSGLYNHLLVHHGTKNICYKFNIIELWNNFVDLYSSEE